MSGATSVVGIEAQGRARGECAESLDLHAPSGSSYRFVGGEVFTVLARERFEVDVVLCLGFLYHTLRYNELLERIRALEPRHVLIDTSVIRAGKQPFVRLRLDRVDRQREAVFDKYSHGDHTLVGRPSVPALRLMLDAYGFRSSASPTGARCFGTTPRRRA